MPKPKLSSATKKALKNDGLSRRKVGDALVEIITHHPRTPGASRDKAAKIVDDAASQMSRLMTGHYDEFSIDRLCQMAKRLGAIVSLDIVWPKHGVARGRGGRIVTSTFVEKA